MDENPKKGIAGIAEKFFVPVIISICGFIFSYEQMQIAQLQVKIAQSQDEHTRNNLRLQATDFTNRIYSDTNSMTTKTNNLISIINMVCGTDTAYAAVLTAMLIEREPSRTVAVGIRDNIVNDPAISSNVKSVVISKYKSKYITDSVPEVVDKNDIHKIEKRPLFGIRSLHRYLMYFEIVKRFLEKYNYEIDNTNISNKDTVRPYWMSYTPTVLYYSDNFKSEATKFADLLSNETGIPFRIQKGAGNISVPEGQLSRYLMIHINVQ